MTRRQSIVSVACVAALVAAAIFQFHSNPWYAMASVWLSSAAIGLDAVVVGVRKRKGVGPSIVNLAPGGWALFGTMFWIVAIPAYFAGARRMTRRRHFGENTSHSPHDEFEPVTFGSFGVLLAVTAIGIALVALGATSGSVSPDR